jgi:hypothetical protein
MDLKTLSNKVKVLQNSKCDNIVIFKYVISYYWDIVIMEIKIAGNITDIKSYRAWGKDFYKTLNLY